MLLTWCDAVLRLTYRRSAISGFDSPAPRSRSTSCSRTVSSADSLGAGAGGDPERAEERRDPIGVERRRRAPRTPPARAGRGRRRRRAELPASARAELEPGAGHLERELQAGPHRERGLQMGGGSLRVTVGHRHPTPGARRHRRQPVAAAPTTRPRPAAARPRSPASTSPVARWASTSRSRAAARCERCSSR